MEPVVRIQAAAAQLGVSESTLKSYERRGLIPKAERNRAGQRVYTEGDLLEIRRVIRPGAKEGGV